MADTELTPIERLARAVQAFANETCPEPNVLVTSFVVGLEWSRFDQDGDQLFAMDYATHGSGVAASLGLAHAVRVMIERDSIADDVEDGDDDG